MKTARELLHLHRSDDEILFRGNPESRDTVPNIELYSVLVSGIPSLPSEVVDNVNTDNNNDRNATTALNGIIPITGRASLDDTTQEHVNW